MRRLDLTNKKDKIKTKKFRQDHQRVTLEAFDL